jgi:uncharacterized protein (DUF2252 family)
MTDREEAAMETNARSVEHPTVAERVARGKTTRAEVSLSASADWQPRPDRPDPVELLEQQSRSRVPELIPIRYGRMLASAFTFFRGTASLMASDLSTDPRTDLHVQLCGDAHLSNFGFFAAPDRRIALSVNDFDETHPGPFEWDVTRLAASFAVAGRDRDFGKKKRRAITTRAVRSYRTAMASFAAMGNLELWYTHLDIDDIEARFGGEMSKKQHKQFAKNMGKARSKTSLRAFDKLTHIVDGELRIIDDPPLVTPFEELMPRDELDRMNDFIPGVIRSYRRTLNGNRRLLLERYRYVHAARKVVGVGSVGTRAYIVLLLGRDQSDPLFLQIKEAQPSVLEPFLGKSRFATHGQRVVEGQRLMQAASDIMLGWFRTDGVDGVTRDFYVRQLWDAKGSARIDHMNRSGMEIYAEACGWTLARAHARSGDAIAISSYLGTDDTFDTSMASFAEAYADQNERDYAALQDAVATGRVAAESDL